MRAARQWRPAAAVLTMLSLAACAVMRIDVDVYKGPLANEEHVQVQQFAAMAVGTRPLLTQLRDSLQWGDKVDTARMRDGYLPGYMHQPMDENGNESASEGRVIWDQQAERVNAVLSLYEDLGDPRLLRFLTAGETALNKYEAALLVLLPSSGDVAFWDGLEPAFRRSDQLGSMLQADFDRLKTSYQEFLQSTGTERQAKCLSYHFSDDFSSDGLEECRKEELSRLDSYLPLMDSQIVGKHAQVLFADDRGIERRNFVDQVVAIAESYFEAREAVRELWEIALDAMIYVDNFAPYSGDVRQEIIDLIAHLITVFTQPQHVAEAITAPVNSSGNETQNSVMRALRRNLMSTDIGDDFWERLPTERGGFTWNSSHFDKANQLERLALQDKPSDMVYQLRVADRLLKAAAANAASPDELGIALSLEELRRYGLARGPSFDPTKENLIEITRLGFDRVAWLSALGFERGRLIKGLFTLIESYLEASADAAGLETVALGRARNQLLDGLVGFAEKVLVIANNDVLFNPSLPSDASESDRDAQEKRESYVRVLQAIGSSILVQADELRHRTVHAEEQHAGTEREQWGLDQVAATSGGDVVEQLHADFTDSLRQAKAALVNDKAQLVSAAQDVLAGSAFVDPLRRPDPNEDAAAAINKAEPATAEIDEVRAAAATAIALLEADDDKSIRKAVLDDIGAGDTDGQTVEGNIEDKLGTAIAATSDPKKKADLRAVQSYFDVSAIRFGGVTAQQAPPVDVYEAILTAIREDQIASHEKHRLLSAWLAAAKAVQTRESKVTQLMNTLAVIDEVQVAAMRKARNAGVVGVPRAVFALLLGEVSIVLGDDTRKDDRPKFEHAYQALTDQGPPPAVLASSALPEGANAETAIEVLDKMIAALRHEYISVVKQVGKNHPRAVNIADAIKIAYEQRSGMVYIRPSSAYLRSSYPSSSLQDDPRLGWQNMLTRHSARGLPFFSETLTNSDDEGRLKIQTEIDKQFWQTINSVRVAGAGDTNYAVVKDDIGNWYVKRYSSNPAVIIESARRLAMFSAGVPVPTSTQEASGVTEDQLIAASAEQDKLESVYDRRAEEYGSRTSDQYQVVMALLGADLSATIKQSWEASPALKDIGNDEERRLFEWLAAAAADLVAAKRKLEGRANASPPPDLGDLILDGLKAMLPFHTRLERDVKSMELHDPSERALLDDLRRIVRQTVIEQAEQRRDIVADYETAITFIGEATNPESQ